MLGVESFQKFLKNPDGYEESFDEGILKAIENNNMKDFTCFFDDVRDVNSADQEGFALLHYASKYGRVEMVKFLLSHGAKVNQVTCSKASSLYLACQKGHLETVQTLIGVGAEVDLSNRIGETSLHVACFKKFDNIVCHLLLSGASVNAEDDAGNTALHNAAVAGSLTIIIDLIVSKADVKKVNKFGETALQIISAKKKSLEEALLEKSEEATELKKSNLEEKRLEYEKAEEMLTAQLSFIERLWKYIWG